MRQSQSFPHSIQCHIRLKRYEEAIEDCRAAIKLNPRSIKAQIHLARALHGRGEFQKAIDILELAEEDSKGHTEVINKYKEEVIADMKKYLLETALTRI